MQEKVVREYTIYYLTSIDEGETLLKSLSGDEIENKFTTSGWYYTYDKQRPCSRSCCYIKTNYLAPISDLIYNLTNKIRSLEDDIDDLADDLKELEPYENPNFTA